MLGERRHKILCLAIEDYIANACPVTSGAVHSKHLTNISSATLRNELNTLEAMGYLKQLHTSSGRVPTAQGYRYYVNSLLTEKRFDPAKLNSIKSRLVRRTNSINEIVSKIVSAISGFAKYPTVAYINSYDKLIIEEISIIPLVYAEAMMLLNTKNGFIHNTIKVSADSKSCDAASRYLTKHFTGKTLKEMIDTIQQDKSVFKEEISSYKPIIKNVVEFLKTLMEKGTMDIRREGSVNLLTNENQSIEQTKRILNLLENEEELKNVIDVGDEKGICFALEDEFSEKELNNDGFAVMKAPIIIGGKQVASVGVVGPSRMDYAKIASALKLVLDEIDAGDI